MDQVPTIISTKDFSYMSDMFNWNYQAFKEVKHFSNEVTDEEVHSLLDGIADMHYYHCMKLISILANEPLEGCDCEESDEEDTDEQ